MGGRARRSTRQRPANRSSGSGAILRSSSSSSRDGVAQNFGLRRQEREHGHASQLLRGHREHAHAVKVRVVHFWVQILGRDGVGVVRLHTVIGQAERTAGGVGLEATVADVRPARRRVEGPTTRRVGRRGRGPPRVFIYVAAPVRPRCVYRHGRGRGRGGEGRVGHGEGHRWRRGEVAAMEVVVQGESLVMGATATKGGGVVMMMTLS